MLAARRLGWLVVLTWCARRLLDSFASAACALGMTQERAKNRPHNARDLERGANCFDRILR
jgi:hypothetical protein